MKKILVIVVSITAALTMVGPAIAADEPLRSKSEVTVASIGKEVRNPTVFQLANNNTLVTWQEVSGDKYYLKARTVSPTKALGTIQTINSEAAIQLQSGEGTERTVVIGSSGKVFATWITQGLRFGVQSQKVWGRTTTDGVNWSKPFVIVAGLTVSGDAMMCEEDPTRVTNCGYSSVQSAVDGKGRLAVMTLDNYESTGIRYRVKATNLSGVWATFRTLAEVPDTRASELVGLASGFAANATSYASSANSAVRTKIYDAKSEAWSKTFTAISTSQNDVYRAHWIQRDSKNLTLAIAAEAGGINIRNFNLTNLNWSANLVQIQGPVAEHVYQNLVAAKVGSDLVLIYQEYDRDAGSTVIKAAKIVGSTPTTTLLQSGADNPVLLYVGASSTNSALVAFNLGTAGTKLGGINEGSLPETISANFGSSAIMTLTKTSADQVLALGLIYEESKTTIALLRGIAN